MGLQMVLPVILVPLFLPSISCTQTQPDDPIVVSVRGEKGGWLGVSVQDMTLQMAKRMKVKTEEGALVNEVIEESPAKTAGVQEDDIIVEFDGDAIEDAEDLVSAVRKTKPGEKTTIVVLRQDQRTPLQVEIGKSPRERPRAFSFKAPRGLRFHWSGSETQIEGLRVTEMTRQLAEYFQVPDGRGVLIEEVEKESPAARAGFAAGDVIINVGSDRVYDTDDIGWALDDRKAGETVEVTVIRKGARKTLNVQVADRQGRLKFRSEREIYIPEPPDIDIDIDIPEEQEEARLQKEGFRRSLEQFRIQMHGLKDEIRGWAHELQTRLRGGIRVRYTI